MILTGRVLHLSKGFRQQYNLSEIARPHLIDLRDRVDETVILTIRQRSSSVSIEQFDPEHPFRMVPHVGNAAPLYATAAGRAIMFTLPTGEQHRIIDELADAPVEHPEVRLDQASWAREYELAQVRGYVWIPRTDDVERVASVVLDRNGAPLAAVSIYGPKYRIHDRIPEMGREARQTAGRISRAAFGAGPGEDCELWADPLVVVRGSVFRGDDVAPSFEEVMRGPLIGLPAANPLQTLIDEQARILGVSPAYRVRLPTLNAVYAVASTGAGAAIVPYGTASRSRTLPAAIHPVAEEWADRRALLITRSAYVPSPAQQEFIDALLRYRDEVDVTEPLGVVIPDSPPERARRG